MNNPPSHNGGENVLWPDCEKCKKYPCPCPNYPFGVKMNETTESGGEPPREIHNVTGSYFSIARYYGGCKAFGTDYVYIPIEDKLIRQDLVKKYKKKDYAKMDRKKEFQPELL